MALNASLFPVAFIFLIIAGRTLGEWHEASIPRNGVRWKCNALGELRGPSRERCQRVPGSSRLNIAPRSPKPARNGRQSRTSNRAYAFAFRSDFRYS